MQRRWASLLLQAIADIWRRSRHDKTWAKYYKALQPLLAKFPAALDHPWLSVSSAAHFFTAYVTEPLVPFSTVETARAAITAVHQAKCWPPPCTFTDARYFGAFFEGLRKSCAAKRTRKTTGAAFTLEQAATLIRFWYNTPPSSAYYLTTQRNAAIAAMQFATGARAEEVLRCERSMLSVRNDGLGLTWSLSSSKNGPITRLIPVTVGSGQSSIRPAQLLQQHMTVGPPTGYIFVSTSVLHRLANCTYQRPTIQQLTVEAWLRAMRSAMRLALPQLDPEDFGTHAFRRGVTTELARTGATPALCSSFLGHRSSKAWAHYVKPSAADTTHLLANLGGLGTTHSSSK
jgi:integrase